MEDELDHIGVAVQAAALGVPRNEVACGEPDARIPTIDL
jgi:hypothetical protein